MLMTLLCLNLLNSCWLYFPHLINFSPSLPIHELRSISWEKKGAGWNKIKERISLHNRSFSCRSHFCNTLSVLKHTWAQPCWARPRVYMVQYPVPSRVSSLEKESDPTRLFLPSYGTLPCWPESFYVHTLIENISKGDFSIISCTPRSSEITQIPLLNPETSTVTSFFKKLKVRSTQKVGKSLEPLIRKPSTKAKNLITQKLRS